MTPLSAESPRKRALKRIVALNNERSSWIGHWREISQYQQPRLGRFFNEQPNRGDKRHQSIYDNTPIFASRTLAAGMMSGMTSPARPWFKLSLADKDLMKAQPVKVWLFQCESLLRAVFAQSNTYRSLHQMYEELGLFGTAAAVITSNFENVVQHYPLTAGEYAIGCDDLGRPNTLSREFQMTVGQIRDQFGLENASQTVQRMADRGLWDAWIDVAQLIEPRKDRDYTRKDAKNMPFSSCYFECGGNEDKFLMESGHKRFPVLAPRWAVTGNDIYGWGPGMECLGDVKQLQHEQLRKSQALDYMVNPPLVVPNAYKESTKARLPGGVMHSDAGVGQGIRSAFDVKLDLGALREDIQDVRARINAAYYADLFRMLANDDRSGITATEIAERKEEKMLMLGPVLERLQNEMLDPLIDITFEHCAEAGILPPPPKEMQGQDLEVEFVSVLAQAQKISATQGLDRLIGTVGSMSQVFPGAADKINADAAIDEYAEGYGVNPDVIVPDDVVAQRRQAKAQAAAAQAQVAAAEPLSKAAKNMSETDPSALQGLQGY